MFATITDADIHPIRSSEIEKAALPNACKRALNMVSKVRVAVTTAHTNVYTVLWTSDVMPEGSAWAIDYHLFARASAGPVGRVRADQCGIFYREMGGVATQDGALGTLAPPIVSIASIGVLLVVVGNTIVLKVLDGGVSTVDWDAVVEVRELR